jgi:hypothetical protein
MQVSTMFSSSASFVVRRLRNSLASAIKPPLIPSKTQRLIQRLLNIAEGSSTQRPQPERIPYRERKRTALQCAN